jgi:eukaryotic-like serine/threonine-protein kinase
MRYGGLLRRDRFGLWLSFALKIVGTDSEFEAKTPRIFPENNVSRPIVALSSGTRLGPYEVLSHLGAGGMGEVWRARDSRLGRDVAIKVLPDDIASSQQALVRFEREARAVASLSHPNILALFDIGEQNGIRYAVTELLEGESLHAALARGPLPLKKSLDLAVQFADALASAHEKGIVHRDVKPGNIFLTNDGRAKLLDFGLARQSVLHSESSFSDSPTEEALTEKGGIVGTVSYMSPEQASGHAVDFRSDQFSLGIVLYEMLAGTRPFKGRTGAETMTAIIREEPEPLESAAPSVPLVVRMIVARLLAKEPSGRFAATRDLAQDLATWRQHISELTSSGLSVGDAANVPVPRWSALSRSAVALGVAALVLGAGILLGRRAPPGGFSATALTSFQRITTFDGVESWPTLSPDGKTVAYQKRVNGRSDVYALRVGGKNPTNLTAGLAGDHGEPSFSPDGRFIAFRSENGASGIFVMEATGESPKRLTDFGHTPAWFPDGKRIALTTEAATDPAYASALSKLWIVDVESGEREEIPGVMAQQPSVSPNGLRIAYWGYQSGAGGQRDIFTVGTGSGRGSPVAVTADAALDWSPFWSGDGRLLYFASDRGGTMNLWRVGIDEESGKVEGDPEPVTVPAAWAGPFRATPDGSWVVFGSVERERTLERMPFDEVTESVSGASVLLARFGNPLNLPHVSPQGDLLTFTEMGITENILVLKTDGTNVRKLTDDIHHYRMSTFSPDGRKVVFHSDRSGTYDLWTIDIDGSGLTPLTRSKSGNIKVPIWSPDGKTIAATDMLGHPLLLPYPRSVEDPLPEPGPLPGKGLRFNPFSWSPDSKSLAGVIWGADGSISGILVYDVEKKTYRRLTATGSVPAFLRDGRRIVFKDGNALKIVDTADARISEILRGDERRAIEFFALSPDNRSLFVSWASQQADLWLAGLGGRK